MPWVPACAGTCGEGVCRFAEAGWAICGNGADGTRKQSGRDAEKSGFLVFRPLLPGAGEGSGMRAVRVGDGAGLDGECCALTPGPFFGKSQCDF